MTMLRPLNETGSLSRSQTLFPERNTSLSETIATLKKSYVGNPSMPPFFPERTHFAARGISVYNPAFIKVTRVAEWCRKLASRICPFNKEAVSKSADPFS